MSAESPERCPRVSVIIPARSEASNIGDVLATLPEDVMLDADGAPDSAELPRFIDALITGAALAKGSHVAL
jgi:hypothetical protein